MRFSRNTRLYLAYGSNLHPIRLNGRLPSSRLLATIELHQCRLAFHKRGMDGSGKCDLIPEQDDHLSLGALYQIAVDEIGELDRLEGGYQQVELELELDRQRLIAFTYQARPEKIDPSLLPFDWYRSLIEAGGDYLGFPTNPRRDLQQFDVQSDSNSERAAHHLQLLQAIQEFNQLRQTPKLATGKLLGWL